MSHQECLRWGDLDLARRQLSVKRTYSHGEGRKYAISEPKSAHSRRSIALPASAVESLHRHRKQQVEARLALEEAYKDEGYVFADALGAPIHPCTLLKRFQRLTH
jgi:integrase